MIYGFAGCEIDTGTHVLRRDGAEVHVEPLVFDLIALVVAAGGRLVSYDEMIAEVWGGRIVSDATLAGRISAARAALGDDGRAQAVIQTVPRRGVRLRVPVASAAGSAPAPLPGAGTGTGPGARQTIRYTTSRDGTGIAYAVAGEGPPLLRGSHWLSHLEHDWTSPVWRPMLERFSRGRRLVRYDQRGTGLSDRRLGSPDVENFADDLEAVADAAGLERFPILAASQSVPVAIAFAARRPERVSRLVLFNGFAQGSTALGEPERTEAMVAMIESGWGVPGSAFMKAFATLFMPGGTQEELASLVEMQALSASPGTAGQLRRAIGAMDVRDLLPRVSAPTLVLHCTGDSIQPLSQGQTLARGLPNAELRLFDSINHIGVPSDPAFAQISAEIERFLDLDAGSGQASSPAGCSQEPTSSS